LTLAIGQPVHLGTPKDTTVSSTLASYTMDIPLTYRAVIYLESDRANSSLFLDLIGGFVNPCCAAEEQRKNQLLVRIG